MADDTVNSSITINFATTAQAGNKIHVELDDDYNELQYGSAKSSFLFGEKAYFSIYTDPIDMAYEIIVSDGVIADEGSGLYTTPTDSPIFANFLNAISASLPKPTDLISSHEWLGNDLGSIGYDRKTITAGEQGIGILRYFIQSAFARKSIAVSNPGAYDSYPVLVYIREVTE